MTPDAILRAYLAERAARAAGGMESSRLFHEVAVSDCHGAPIYERNQQTLCLKCRQPCGLKWLGATRASSRRGNRRRPEVRVRESRVLRLGASDEAMAGSVERWLLLSPIVEPAPPNVHERRWAFALKAWEACLHERLSRTDGAIERFGNAYWWHLGAWTDTRIADAVCEARDVVRRRAEPLEKELRSALGMRRAS